METFGIFDGGETGGGESRGQFVQSAANRSAVQAGGQPKGPRPASQANYRAPNPSNAVAIANAQNQVATRDIGDRSLLGSNASANFETYHDTIATRARVWAGQGPDPFSRSGKKDPNRAIMVTEIKSFLLGFITDFCKFRKKFRPVIFVLKNRTFCSTLFADANDLYQNMRQNQLVATKTVG